LSNWANIASVPDFSFMIFFKIFLKLIQLGS
jgi:hypothetical protein